MNLRSRAPFRTRGYRILAAVVALVPVLVLGVSGPAQAVTTQVSTDGLVLGSGTGGAPSCPSSTFCTFQNANFNRTTAGSRWNYAYSSRPHGVWFFTGSSANDQISSEFNNRAWVSYLAKNCPADSQWDYASPHTYDPNFTSDTWPNGSGANDSTSAIALGTSTGHPAPSHGQC